jgi:hypothetical protein
MSLGWASDWKDLIWGTRVAGWESGPVDSLCFQAILCDLRPRFIPKCRVGGGYRAVARNGRVLLASNLPMESLIERKVAIRLQLWRKIILPGTKPEAYGVLMCARGLDPGVRSGFEGQAVYHSCLVSEPPSAADLAVDLGGGMALVFFPQMESTRTRFI